jgi:hypothetical protein
VKFRCHDCFNRYFNCVYWFIGWGWGIWIQAPKNVAKQWKSLPEEEKRPFQDAVKDAWKNHVKERGERPEAPKKVIWVGACLLKIMKI